MSVLLLHVLQNYLWTIIDRVFYAYVKIRSCADKVVPVGGGWWETADATPLLTVTARGRNRRKLGFLADPALCWSTTLLTLTPAVPQKAHHVTLVEYTLVAVLALYNYSGASG